MKFQCQTASYLPTEEAAPVVAGRPREFKTVNNPEFAPLDQFATHQLRELSKLELMDRVDTKFVIPRALVADLLTMLQHDYSALEINGQRRFRYVNTYYDSAGYHHYLCHHNNRMNRFQIRLRSYIDTKTSFLEVKYKNNKHRTLKTRMPVTPEQSDAGADLTAFLSDTGLPDCHALQPIQTGSYFRVALVNQNRGERITLDSGLYFYDITQKLRHALGPWVIVEIKQYQRNRLSPLFQWARNHGLRTIKFSKYCMGVYFTGPDHLQRNRFHEIARQLQTRRLIQA